VQLEQFGQERYDAFFDLPTNAADTDDGSMMCTDCGISPGPTRHDWFR